MGVKMAGFWVGDAEPSGGSVGVVVAHECLEGFWAAEFVERRGFKFDSPWRPTRWDALRRV
jgi:hypothetical protein